MVDSLEKTDELESQQAAIKLIEKTLREIVPNQNNKIIIDSLNTQLSAIKAELNT